MEPLDSLANLSCSCPTLFLLHCFALFNECLPCRCYVGKARLENAVDRFRSAHPGVQVQISFGPYMIDPATQPQGEEYMAYTRRRWGGDGWTGSLKR